MNHAFVWSAVYLTATWHLLQTASWKRITPLCDPHYLTATWHLLQTASWKWITLLCDPRYISLQHGTFYKQRPENESRFCVIRSISHCNMAPFTNSVLKRNHAFVWSAVYLTATWHLLQTASWKWITRLCDPRYISLQHGTLYKQRPENESRFCVIRGISHCNMAPFTNSVLKMNHPFVDPRYISLQHGTFYKQRPENESRVCVIRGISHCNMAPFTNSVLKTNHAFVWSALSHCNMAPFTNSVLKMNHAFVWSAVYLTATCYLLQTASWKWITLLCDPQYISLQHGTFYKKCPEKESRFCVIRSISHCNMAPFTNSVLKRNHAFVWSAVSLQHGTFYKQRPKNKSRFCVICGLSHCNMAPITNSVLKMNHAFVWSAVYLTATWHLLQTASWKRITLLCDPRYISLQHGTFYKQRPENESRFCVIRGISHCNMAPFTNSVLKINHAFV